MPYPLRPIDLRGRRVVWCLELTWASRVFRLSTEPVELVDADSVSIPFDGGLSDPLFEESMERLETEASESSASMEVYLPVDVALERQKGHDPATATGELSMVLVRGPHGGAVVDQTYETRFRVFAGRVEGAQWSDPEQPAGWLAFTLREQAYEDSSTIIPIHWRVTSDAWTFAEPEHYGKVYPLVFGTPGVYIDTDGSPQKKGATPAYIVTTAGGNANLLLIAGHPVAATSVTIFDSTTSESFPVSHQGETGFSQVGVQVAVVDVTGAAAISRTESEYWVCWDDGGGIPYEAGNLERLGDVIAHFLGLGSIPVDYGRWAAVGVLLNGIIVGGYVNDPEATPWDYIVAHLLPLAPLSVLRGPDGLFPVPHDPDWSSARPISAITAGEEWTRIGPIQGERSRDDIVNEYELAYAVGHESAGRRVAVVGSRNDEEAEQSSSSYTLISIGRYGATQASSTSDVLWNDSSAQVVAHMTVRESSLQIESAPYAAPITAGWHQLGDQITITDAAAQWTDARCVIYSKSWTGTGWEFLVLRDDDPIHDVRST